MGPELHSILAMGTSSCWKNAVAASAIVGFQALPWTIVHRNVPTASQNHHK